MHIYTYFESTYISNKGCSLTENHYNNNNTIIKNIIKSGFRPRHSTETALVKITNDLLLASDQGCISLLVLLDLSAAFDTIDHDILIDRLQNYTGIQGQALRWFRSYLSDRYHFVYLNRESSQLSPVKVWSTTRICPRSSAIFIIHVAPWYYY